MEHNNLSNVAFCGLCCLDCHAYTGTIADLAKSLRKELRTAKYDKFAEKIAEYPFAAKFRNYQECYELLGEMMKFRCKKGCRNNGGPPFCNIRSCCQEKNIPGCWECDLFSECEKLDFLNNVHGQAHRKNLARIKKHGVDAFVAGKRDW